VNRSLIWKLVLIVGVLVAFTVAIIPTKSNPEPSGAVSTSRAALTSSCV